MPNSNAQKSFDPNSAASILDRLADVLLAENMRGYMIRLITEPLPLFVIWSIGDLLGFLTGWRDYRYGQATKGMIKMATAAIPFFPTIPVHIVIDKMFGSTPKQVPHNRMISTTNS